MDDEEALKESVSNLRSAILLRRTDIVRSILSTAAEYREEDGLFGDDEGEEQEEEDQLGIAKQFYYDEYDDPYDILKMMMNYVDNDAGTCLHLATKLGYADAVRALLAAGSDPTITNSEGATAFDYCTDEIILGVYNEELLQASANSNVPRVRKLLKSGVSVNASDGAPSDNKALHWAVSYGNENIVKFLCESEAKVNILNKAGVTPLHEAVIRGDLGIARILLEHGATLNIKAKTGLYEGQTAADLAMSDEMKELLSGPVVKAEEPAVNGEVSQHSNTDSLASDGGVSSVTAANIPSSLLTSPSSLSYSQLLSNMPSMTNSESLDPLFNTLWPFPQRITQLKGARFFPPSSLNVVLFRRTRSGYFEELCDIWNTVEGTFEQLGYTIDVKVVPEDSGIKGSVAGSVECHVCPNSFNKSENYNISVSAVKVVISASDPPAIWCAVNTLLQVFRLFHGKGVPQMQLNDWPDLRYRGVLWDVSTGRVPNLETVFSLIDVLSAMKINQLQLYMQNTFSFAGHETVWRNKTPYSTSDIVKIDNYCKRRYIELVPHVESLSGFSYWFMFKSYKHLAEEEVEFDPKLERQPSCLSPTNDGSLNMVLGLHSQAFPCFSSTRFAHVGLDLAPEFGRGKSHVIAQAKGADEMYMSYLRCLHQSCSKHGRTIQFWANALHQDPEQLWNLPPGVVAMEYGCTADHDFLKYCKPLADAGVSFFTCAGTGTWNSACGDIAEFVSVMSHAAQTAVLCNALGALVCDWSLPGHVNPLTVSIPALLAGAGLAWKANTDVASIKSSLPEVLNQHVFFDNSCTFGQALFDLATTHSLLNCDHLSQSRIADADIRVHPLARASDGTLLWQILEKGGLATLDNVSLDSLQRAARHIRQCHKTFLGAELQCKQKTEIIKELGVLVDILLFAVRLCRMILLNQKQNSSGALKDLPAINRTDLANKLLALVDLYHKAYLLRNKQGGLVSALQLLQNFLQHLLPSNGI